MSRQMKEAATEAFRVVLERTVNGKPFSSVTFGTFSSLSVAKGIRTREIYEWCGRYANMGRTATGRIQRTEHVWVDVDE